MAGTTAVVVARGRSVLTADGMQGPGTSLDLKADEAALLVVRGFVTRTGQEPVEPRTTRVEAASPDRIGLQTGPLP